MDGIEHPDSPWRVSTRSFSNGQCAEVAAWRVGTRSMSNGHCTEVGQGPAVAAVRDSRLGGRSPVLLFPAAAWREFTARIRAVPAPGNLAG